MVIFFILCRRWGQKTDEVLEQLEKNLIVMLCILWLLCDVEQFRSNFDLFMCFWSTTDADYMWYFQAQWYDSQPPHLWAKFGRLPHAPSGDQILEGWHHCLQGSLLQNQGLRMDRLIDRLREEWRWYHAMLSDAGLHEEH